MTFEVEVNGRLRRVSIEGVGAVGPAGGRFRIVVQDEAGGAEGPPRASAPGGVQPPPRSSGEPGRSQDGVGRGSPPIQEVARERRGAEGPPRASAPGGVQGSPPIQEIDCRPTALGLSLVFLADGRSLDAAVTPRSATEWFVQLPHASLTALVDARRFAGSGSGAVAAAGEQRVTAPMPGRVIRVLVKAGDEVAVRQGLVVVEAMKMENELASPKAGRVKEVAVAEGQSVETGRLLVVVE